MKKFFKVGFICMAIISSISAVKAFGWVPSSPYYICWYNRGDETMCRNLSQIQSSIVTYGNSKKVGLEMRQLKIQDKWFELIKPVNSKYTNVIVMYTFDNNAAPNFVGSPYLAAGTPQ